MKTHKEIEDYILSLDGARLDFPFGESTSVYRLDEEGDDKMFALIDNNAKPVRLSLKCDPLLAIKLREDYETVLPGYHLNKKHWNTIICSGQIPHEEMISLILMSYNLAKGVKF